MGVADPFKGNAKLQTVSVSKNITKSKKKLGLILFHPKGDMQESCSCHRSRFEFALSGAVGTWPNENDIVTRLGAVINVDLFANEKC